MNTIEILKHQATRQFRHNNDNSPDVFNPKDGFVIAYDMDTIDKGLADLKTKLDTAEQELAWRDAEVAWIDAKAREYGYSGLAFVIQNRGDRPIKDFEEVIENG